jgi:hypothetical protein
LPDPYPFKDDGCGLWFPPAKEGERPQQWFPVAQAVAQRSGESQASGGYDVGLSKR